jgi:hypothetical protein
MDTTIPGLVKLLRSQNHLLTPPRDGSERFAAKRATGIPATRYDGSVASATVDREAYAAEKWAAGRLGADFNEEIYADHGDGGRDFTVNGKSAEVVWFGVDKNGLPRRNGNLIVNPEEPQRWADRYLVVGGSIEAGHYWVGWAKHEDVLAARKKDLGYGPKWVIPLNARSPRVTADDTLFLRSPELLP